MKQKDRLGGSQNGLRKMEGENKSPWPGVSVFTKNKRGEIFRVSDAGFGPGDNFCVLWNLFDLLPQLYKEEGIDYFYSEVR